MRRYSCMFDIITFQSLTWKKYKTRWLYFKILGQLPEDIMLVDGMISLVDWPVKAKKNPNLPAILGKEKPPPTSGNNPGRAKDRYMEKASATTTPINNDNNYQQHTIITHTITKNINNNTITHVYNQEYSTGYAQYKIRCAAVSMIDERFLHLANSKMPLIHYL